MVSFISLDHYVFFCLTEVSLLKKFSILSVNQLNAQAKLLEVWKALNIPSYPLKIAQQSQQHTGVTTRADIKERPKDIGRSTNTKKPCISDAIRLWNFIYLYGANKRKNILQMILFECMDHETIMRKISVLHNLCQGTSKKLIFLVFLICFPFSFVQDYHLVEGFSRTQSSIDVLKGGEAVY